jgi:hypothetical protein
LNVKHRVGDIALLEHVLVLVKFENLFPGSDFGDKNLRWSRFLRQAVKVDLLTKRMIHHEDTQTVYS